MKKLITYKIILIVFVIFIVNSSGKHCNAGIFDALECLYDAELCTAEEKTLVSQSDGSFKFCYDVYRGNDTKKLCKAYAEAENETKDRCLSKRINGDETQAGIREIYKICNKEGSKAGENAAKWFIRKKKILKPFFGD